VSFRPSSLAQLFPPGEHQGVFGWVCGYSADAGFLEDAIERFSALTQAQRAHQGKVMLAVMLDPGNPQIAPSEVPGMLHLPVKSPELPFLLLHAKVAVLGFQCGDRFLMRAIVTTGNWTRQTLEESLDLAWHIDVASKAKTKPRRPCGRNVPISPPSGSSCRGYARTSMRVLSTSLEEPIPIPPRSKKSPHGPPSSVRVTVATGRASSTTATIPCFGSLPISSETTRAPPPETILLLARGSMKACSPGYQTFPNQYSGIFRNADFSRQPATRTSSSILEHVRPSQRAARGSRSRVGSFDRRVFRIISARLRGHSMPSSFSAPTSATVRTIAVAHGSILVRAI
jgi:hypothetical protein